jgi:hypothetical protein
MNRTTMATGKGWMGLCAALVVVGAASEARAEDAPPRERRSTAMMATGIALTAVGGSAVLAGGVLVGAALASQAETPYASYGYGYGYAASTASAYYGYPYDSGADGMLLAGVIAIAAGHAALGVGIPLWVVGAQPKEPEKVEPGVALSVSPTAVRVDGRF